MRQLIYLLVLASGIHAAPHCKNITVTSTWLQPPTSINQKCASSFTFIIPTGYYANVKVGVTDALGVEMVSVFDSNGPMYQLSGASSQNVSIYFPSSFNVVVEVQEKDSTMKLQISVTAIKIKPPTSVTQVTTNVNKQPTLIYYKDWVAGTAYTFTSSSSTSRIVVATDPHLLEYTVQQKVLMNNVFITDGGANNGTLADCWPITAPYDYCLSSSKQITLTLVDSANLMGAILVTDYENIKDLYSYQVEFVPVNYGGAPGFADFFGAYEKPIAGAMTIIGEKNGATPITVTKLGTGGDGGKFTQLSGGPVVNYGVVGSPLFNVNLPKTFGGSMNTFVISTGEAEISYTI